MWAILSRILEGHYLNAIHLPGPGPALLGLLPREISRDSEVGEFTSFGLDPGELPAVADCDAVVGETSAFGRTVPLCGLAVDQQAALFAESCLERGDAKCTYGTGAFLLATVGDRPVRSRSGLVGCVAWRLGGRATWCLDGQVFGLFVLVAAAVEAGLGLGLVVLLFRRRGTLDAEAWSTMHG